MEIISREDAKAAGLTRYYTGKPCKHGHVAERAVINSGCIACKAAWKASPAAKARGKEYRQANKETYRSRSRKYRQTNKEALKAYSRDYSRANKEAIATRKREYRRANKEARAAYHREYMQAKPEVHRARRAKRRAAKLQRTVAWADLAAIREFYATALPGEHVDHIIPLQGELVSGLHVEYNLQHLPGSDNLGKSNKFDPVTYIHELPTSR